MSDSATHQQVVIDGDIERRIISVYTPDFYKDNPSFGTVNDMLKASVPILDYMLEKARAMTLLVDVDNCPEEFLYHLASLVGYTWKSHLSPDRQRQELRRIVQVYHIRGTPLSAVRLVLNLGAVTGQVNTPFESIAHTDLSKWDSGHRYEDEIFWRWGTYEVVADIDFAPVHADINDVHPAGTVWFGRHLIPTTRESPPDADEAVEQETLVVHTVDVDYRTTSAENYESVVLDTAHAGAAAPNGYWRLNEPAGLDIAPATGTATFGDALYDMSSYGGAVDGVVAADSTSNAYDGLYKIEKEQLTTGDGTTKVFGPFTVSNPPITPRQIQVVAPGIVGADDGLGNISGTGITGAVDYTTGQLSDLTFTTAPGAGSSTFPITSQPSTLATLDNLEVWLDALALTGYTSGDTITSLTELSPNARTITGVSGKEPTYTLTLAGGSSPSYNDSIPAFSFGIGGGKAFTLGTGLDLGVNHTISVSFSSIGAADQVFCGDDGDDSRLWYDDTANQIKYRPNGGTDVSLYSVDLNTIGVTTRYFNDDMVVTLKREGSAVALYFNGTEVGSTTVAGGDEAKPFTLKYIGAADDVVNLETNTICRFTAYSTAVNPDSRYLNDLYMGAPGGGVLSVWGHFDAAALPNTTPDGSGIVTISDTTNTYDPQNYQTPYRAFTVGGHFDYDIGDLYEDIFAIKAWSHADTLSFPDGELISSWEADALGDMWIQATSSLRPSFLGNGQNGMPAVSFKGGKVLEHNPYYSSEYPSVFKGIVCMSIRFTSFNTTQKIIAGDAVDEAYIQFNPTTGVFTWSISASNSVAFDAVSLTKDRWYVLTFTWGTDGEARLWVDGTESSTSKTVPDPSKIFTIKYLGGEGATPTSTLYADIAHLHIDFESVSWTDVSSRERRATIEGAMAQRLGISLASAVLYRRGVTPTGGPAFQSNKYSQMGVNGYPGTPINEIYEYGAHNTIAAVFRVTDTSIPTTNYLTDQLYVTNNPTTGLGSIEYYGGTASWSSIAYDFSAWTVLLITLKDGTAEAFLNGTSLGTKSITAGLVRKTEYLFSSPGNALRGYLAELLISDVGLDARQHNRLQSYLGTRHGIPMATPTSTPSIDVFYNDYVQRGVPGALVGGVATAARFGYDASVNRDLVELPSEDALFPRTHDWSVEAWIKCARGLGGTFFGSEWIDSLIQYRLRGRVVRSTGRVQFELKGAGVTPYTVTSCRCEGFVNDDQWHHVVLAIDTTLKQIEIYIDGVLNISLDVPILGTEDFDLGSSFFNIGGLGVNASSPDYFKGDIDEVAIYGDKLALNLIALHHSMGAGNIVSPANTFTYMRFIEEEVNAFGKRGFKLDKSSLGGPAQLDVEDVIEIVFDEDPVWSLNPGGGASDVGVSDSVEIYVSHWFKSLSDSVSVSDTMSTST